MSEDVQQVHLPGIAVNQPDVYESEPLSGAAETKKKYEDDTHSSSVSKLECGVNRSFDAFRNKALDSQNTDFSDEVRQGFGSLPDCVPVGGALRAETTLERYKRLEHEVSELLSDLERLKSTSDEQATESADESAVSVSQLEQLQTQLRGVGLGVLQGQSTAKPYSDLLSKNVLAKLESTKDINTSQSSATAGDSTVYELYYKPETAKFAHLSKLSQLEGRLAELESIVGLSDTKPSVISGGLDEKMCIAERLASLHSKVALLDASHVAGADMRLQGLIKSLQQVKQAQAEDSDAQSKVSEIYDTIQQWDKVAALLPELIDRLHTLKALHQQATDFSNSLAQIGDGQSRLNSQLSTDREMLAQLKATFTDNMAEIERNCKTLEGRIATLMKK